MKKAIFLTIFASFFVHCEYQSREWQTVVSKPNTPQAPTPQPSTSIKQKVTFKDIKPLFQKHCMLCHGSTPAIDWTSFDVSKEYGLNGKLYERIWSLKDDPVQGMPLGNAFQMTIEERQKIIDWIKDGLNP